MRWTALLLALLIGGCDGDSRPRIVVFAASSLTDAMTESSRAFEKAHGCQVDLSFESSASLAQKIRRGAPADVLVSAAPDPLEMLSAAGRVKASRIRTLANNRLVIVVPDETPGHIRRPQDLLELERIAVGQPDSVPAGVYARRALEKNGLWSDLRPSLIPANHVRAVLAYVETGAVDAGIVYETDARVSSRVRIEYRFPEVRTRIQAAPIKSSEHPDLAHRFIRFHSEGEGSKVLLRFGFER